MGIAATTAMLRMPMTLQHQNAAVTSLLLLSNALATLELLRAKGCRCCTQCTVVATRKALTVLHVKRCTTPSYGCSATAWAATRMRYRYCVIGHKRMRSPYSGMSCDAFAEPLQWRGRNA